MEATRKQDIIDIGLDVDDTQYHGSAFNKNSVKLLISSAGPH